MKTDKVDPDLATQLIKLFIDKIIQLLEAAVNRLRSVNIWLDTVLLRGDDGPTVLQWINRLMEYVDGQYLLDAAKRFVWLVDSGVDPDHAFRMVVEV